MSQTRALVAFCPDWAVIVAGRPPSAKVAVVHANRVVATSPAARAGGVRAGMRRREAQGICPEVEVVRRDLAAEARSWEPVVAAVETIAPGVEVLGPGQLALGSRGPSRYFGGDMTLAARVAGAVELVVARTGSGFGWTDYCRVGIADGLFAAGLAARLAPAREHLVVPKGASGEFLAPVPLKVLVNAGSGGPPRRPARSSPPGPAATAGITRRSSSGGAAGEEETGLPGTAGADFAGLVDLLSRLGLKTLGDFAALPAASVLGRFGAEGLLAHCLARGLGERTVRGRLPPPDWAVSAELDPPADQLQAAVFVGRALAEELNDRLVGSGLVCTRLTIEAETEYGTTLRRSWRHDGALSAAAIGERVRWQLEGWAVAGQAAGQIGPGETAHAGGGVGPAQAGGGVEVAQAGRVSRLALVPEEVRPDDGRQLGFWGNDAGKAARAARALARVQALLGPEAALTAVLQGGRDHHEQVLLVPWGEPRVAPGATRAQENQVKGKAGAKTKVKPKDGAPPWPGRLPGLAPAIVHCSPLAAQVLDEEGNQVSVGSRGVISAPPAWVVIGQGRRAAVGAWAGPWPLEERWWEAGGRRRARLQVRTDDGSCYLLAREEHRWWVEATYD